MICLTTFSVTLDVRASTTLFDRTYSYSYTTPRIYTAELGSSTTETFVDSVDYNTGFNMKADKWYKILFLISGLNSYATTSGGTVSTEMFVTYGGQRYYMGRNFICLIVPGNDYSIVGFGSEVTVTLSPSSENIMQTQGVFTCSPNLVVYELTESEVEAYSGQSQVVGSIEQGNILQMEENALQKELNDLQKEENETSKGIFSAITDFFGSFFGNLIDAVLSLFIPSSEEMGALFDELNQFFSDTFGFLYYPFDFLIRAFDIFLDGDSGTGVTLPGFSIMGYEVWSEQTYDLASDELVGTVFEFVRIGTGALLSMAFVSYLRNFFDKRFGGGGS